ncbi:MAG: hypothetical protein GY780_11770 [bacterium]|nr:hypothetical protein [bacterium]
MRCNKAQENLSLELDGVLPPDRTGALTSHLDGCGDCRKYRDDLLMGTRILQATEPELPDNFDWKLQLKLNQALKETAGEVAYPWEDKPRDRWSWLRNFGSAAAVGMAAVLALAIFFGPLNEPVPSGGGQYSSPIVQGNDRLPLNQKYNFGTGMGRPVSSGSSFDQRVNQFKISPEMNQGWSGDSARDLRTIQALRKQNRQLNQSLYQIQRQNIWMRAQLDTSLQKPEGLKEK